MIIIPIAIVIIIILILIGKRNKITETNKGIKIPIAKNKNDTNVQTVYGIYELDKDA